MTDLMCGMCEGAQELIDRFEVGGVVDLHVLTATAKAGLDELNVAIVMLDAPSMSSDEFIARTARARSLAVQLAITAIALATSVPSRDDAVDFILGDGGWLQ